MNDTAKLIEAALFTSPKPLTLTDLYNITKKNVSELRIALNEVVDFYNNNDSALEIVETLQGFQMKARKQWDEKVSHLTKAPELSKGVLKTLAFIAYKQPMKQSDLVKYRTTSAYDEVKVLEEKGYITREPKERTFIVRTTKKFLQEFGEDSLTLKEKEKINQP
ncbi:MAG: segregation and condensation protein B [archaeon GW2011_AR21]|uniref:SMC-Scp complex subunit ScpB n=1 Tax=Candidatus Iainarchaeum sp. TaxID=3101447 RepID=A0A7J4JUF7_9ARCH|nr:MAG: segregation and condensation protein B [archaeon GW2011_AR21]HIH21422.1 SMC-Scp complex subunit ScpB [Candidatus Diapherotrites archaeon]